MSIYKIEDVGMEGKGPYTVLILVEASSKKEARSKAAKLLNNKEIVATGFYQAIPMSKNEIWKRKKTLEKELSKYQNIK